MKARLSYALNPLGKTDVSSDITRDCWLGTARPNLKGIRNGPEAGQMFGKYPLTVGI
jgi:hypothetical protein